MRFDFVYIFSEMRPLFPMADIFFQMCERGFTDMITGTPNYRFVIEILDLYETNTNWKQTTPTEWEIGVLKYGPSTKYSWEI